MSADPESTEPRAEASGPSAEGAVPRPEPTANGSSTHGPTESGSAPEAANGEAAQASAPSNGHSSAPPEPAPPPAAFPSFPPPGTVPETSASTPPAAARTPAGAPSGNPPPPPRTGPVPADDQPMTLWEHLDELRSRIIRMIIAFLIGAVVAWIFREHLLYWLSEPFIKAWPKAVGDSTAANAKLHFASPAALFIAYVRLSAMGGLVFALPFILYQVWAFVAPGLYAREKKFAAPFVLSSCALFAAGGWFGWRFAFPVAFQFLLGLANTGSLSKELEIQPTLMVSDYIEFVTHMLLAFGFMSELPILVFFLSIAGIVNHRHLIKFFRYFIVVAFVVAAVITPPDPMSQLMLAIPLIFLYGVSILVAFIFGKRDLVPSQPASENK